MRRFAVAVLLLALLGTGVVVASSPPTALCGVCGDDGPRHPSADIDEPVLEDVSFGDSSLIVRVSNNGSSTWTERVTLDRTSAERLASDPALRQRFVEQRHERYVINDPDTFETSVDDRTLIVRYRVADSADSGVGDVLLFDQLHQLGKSYHVNADRVVIRGPPGTTVVNEPPSGTVENGSVVYVPGDSPTGQTYIAFASDDGLVADYAAGLTMALDIGPVMFGQALPYAAVLGLIWGCVGLGTVVHGRNGSGVASEPTEESSIEPPEESPAEPRGRSTSLLVGSALLLSIPLLLVLPLNYHYAFPIALLAVPMFWVSLGTAQTARAQWGSVAALASLPMIIFLSITPVAGLGGIFLIFIFMTGLVATPFGFALYWLANRFTPSPYPDD